MKKILVVKVTIILSIMMIVLTGCANDNQTDDNVSENTVTQQETEDVAKAKDTNIRLDARYTSSSKDCQIDLYSDNTMYLAYVPRTGTSEYYTGTFTISGDTITVNLIPDDTEKTQIMDQENPKKFTIISDEEFKDKNENVYKYSIDYKKGLLPNEQ